MSGCHKPCLVNRAFVPCQKGAVCDENGENDEFAFYPLKTRGFAPQNPENAGEMTKWQVSLRQRHGLDKAGFVLPGLSGLLGYLSLLFFIVSSSSTSNNRITLEEAIDYKVVLDCILQITSIIL